jgi:hypothetical protein
MVGVALVLTGPTASEIPNVQQVLNEDLLKHGSIGPDFREPYILD